MGATSRYSEDSARDASGPGPSSLFEAAAALAGIGAWSCDLEDDRLSWTAGVYDLFGLDRSERLDRRAIVSLYEEESRERMERARTASILHGLPFDIEAEIVRPSGERRWMRLTGNPAQHGGGPARLFGIKQDITEEKTRLEQLRRQAERDALTGLCNRSMFQSHFLENGAPQPGVAPLGALVLFDVDGFKLINDRHGHAAGDACLETFARRLSRAFPEALMSARIGGDEFALLMPAEAVDLGQGEAMPCFGEDPLELRIAAQLRMLSAPVHWHGSLLALTSSAGLAFADHPTRYDAEAMFAAADDALYAAKRAGRNQLRVSTASARMRQAFG